MSTGKRLLPLTPLQVGTVVQWLRDPSRRVGTVVHTYTLHGELDVPALRQAWSTVAQSHVALRSCLAFHEGEMWLQVLDDARAQFQLSGPSESASPAGADSGADGQWSADLTRLPLVRLTLCPLGHGRHRLTWQGHHFATDGWSRAILIDRLFGAYEDIVCCRPLEHVSDGLPAALLAVAARDKEANLVFWTRYLRHVSQPATLAAGSDQRVARHTLDTALVDRLSSAARRARLTLASLMTAAWGIALLRARGVSRLTFGEATSGRGLLPAHASAAVGLLASTLPTVIDGELTYEPRTLQAFQSSQARRRTHEHPELWRIREVLGLPPGSQLFADLFAFESYPDMRRTAAGVIVADEGSWHLTGYPVALSVFPRRRPVLLQLEHDPTSDVDGEALLHGYLEQLLLAAERLGAA